MKVRFLADADLNEAIVIGVHRREPSLDFLSAHTAKTVSDDMLKSQVVSPAALRFVAE